MPSKEPEGFIRRCLRCDENFRSKGPHNRLCDRCNTHNAHVEMPPVMNLIDRSGRVIRKAIEGPS